MAEAGDQLVVPSPSNPMAVAREHVRQQHVHESGALTIAHHRGAFYSWTGSWWAEDDETSVRSRLYAWLEDAVYEADAGEVKPWRPNRHKVANVVDALRAVAHISDRLTPPCWTGENDPPAAVDELVAVGNGLLHVPTRTLHEHTPGLFNLSAAPVRFDPDAPVPQRWLAFLDELWPEDPESVGALQEWFGYVLSGDTRRHRILLLVGPARSGKGTIGRILTGLVGHEHVAGPTLAALTSNFGLAALIDKPLAIIADARITRSAPALVERLLSISGEDTLDVDRKFREAWSGRLPTRLMILTNELPRLADTSGALAKRFLPLTLNRSWLGQEDTELTDTLLAELPGILNWSLDGLERLHQRGRFTEPSSSHDAVRELEDLSSPVGAFLRDRCHLDPTAETPVEELYRAWCSWCEDRGRDRPGDEQSFGRNLRAVVPGLEVRRPRGEDGRQRRVYAGIGLGTTPPLNGESRDSSRLNADADALRRAETRHALFRGQVHGPTCATCGAPSNSTDVDGTEKCAEHATWNQT